MLQVASEGEACAHLILPSEQIQSTASAILEAVDQAREKWRNAREERSNPRDPVKHSIEFTSVAGPCDLIVRIVLDDFRFINDVQSRFLGTPSESSGWILSVPYVSLRSIEDTSMSAIRFSVYLRVKRSVYRALGQQAEELIVRSLEDMIDRRPSIAASIHYSLGWADLILRGHFSCEVDEFSQFLVELQALHILSKNKSREAESVTETGLYKIHIFQRTLTLLGVAIERLEGLAHSVQVRPLIMARSSPGQFIQAKEKLTQFVDKLWGDGENSPSETGTYAMDGKWDLVVLPRSGYRNLDLGDFFEAISSLKSSLMDSGVQRTETHLLFIEGDKLRPPDVPPRLPDLQSLDRLSSCKCSAPVAEIGSVVMRLKKGGLPDSLRTTVTNRLTVFQYALRDTTNCCDSRSALIACLRGLEMLLRRVEIVERYVQHRTDRQADWYGYLHSLWKHIEQWCVISGSVLRERSAGSFEDIYHRSSSVPEHRGGLQKILFIADHLIQEFYERIPDVVKAPAARALGFCTVFEPKSSIHSERFMGIVKIPLRYAFSLQLVLPQLWHEAAQSVFHLNYSLPTSTILERRLRETRTLLNQRVKQQRGRVEPLRVAELVQLQSDMFSDLLVFCYGFRRRFDDFLTYLTTLILETIRPNRTPKPLHRRYFSLLLCRLFYVYEFQELMTTVELNRDAGDEVLRQALQLRSVELREASSKVIGGLLFKVKAVIEKPHYSGHFSIPNHTYSRAYNWVDTIVYSILLEPSLLDLVVSLRKTDLTLAVRPDVDLSAFDNGEVTDFEDGAELNDYYFAFYRREVEKLLDIAPGNLNDPQYAQMAALGRSANLAFYKRQKD